MQTNIDQPHAPTILKTDPQRQCLPAEGVVSPVILIGLMGVTGSGKSNFAKMASDDQKIVVGRRLKSCTKTVEATDIFEVEGYKVQLVDTPGFNDDELTDAQVLSLIADWMKKSFDENQKLHGIMYLQRINDIRLDSGAVRCLQLFRDICGPNFLENTVLVTTMWDKGKDPVLVEENEDTELELINVHWNVLMQSGAMYERSNNKKEDCTNIVSRIVQRQPKMAKLQEEVAMKGLGVGETGAGMNLLKHLSAEIEKLTKTFQEKIKKLEESHAKETEARTKETEARTKETEALKKQTEVLEARLMKYELDRGLLTSGGSKRVEGQGVADKDKVRRKKTFGERLRFLVSK